MIEQGAGEEEGEEDNKIKEKRADEDRGSRKYSKIDRNSTWFSEEMLAADCYSARSRCNNKLWFSFEIGGCQADS